MPVFHDFFFSFSYISACRCLLPPIKLKPCGKWHFTAQQGEIIKKDKMLTQASFSSPHLLCYYLTLQKPLWSPGHPSFLPLPLCSTCQQPFLLSLLLIFFPLTTLESVFFSFWLFKVGFQSHTLSLVQLSNRLLHCFSMWHTLAFLTSTPPTRIYPSLSVLPFACFFSCRCCIVNTPYSKAIWRVSF